MHEFEVSKEIKGSIEDVWRVLDAFSDTWVHHPVVEKSHSTNGKKGGLGARRQCVMYDGGKLEEQIVEYNPHDHSYKVEVVEMGPFPLKSMHVTITCVATGASNTRVIYKGGFDPKFGPMGWLMAKMMMVGQFEKMMGGLIDGLEKHLETGRTIGKGGVVENRTASQAA